MQYLDHPVLGFLRISREVNRIWSKSRSVLGVEGQLSSTVGIALSTEVIDSSVPPEGFSRPRRGLLRSVKAFSTPGHHKNERHLGEECVHEPCWMPRCLLERECPPPQPASPLALAEHCAGGRTPRSIGSMTPNGLCLMWTYFPRAHRWPLDGCFHHTFVETNSIHSDVCGSNSGFEQKVGDAVTSDLQTAQASELT
jgi:hypothetical protein